MDSTRTKSRPNPRENANIVSVLLWWWTIDLFRKGYTKSLDMEDLYEPLKEDRSNALGDRLEKQWTIELENSKKQKRMPSLLKTVVRTFLSEFAHLALMQLIVEFFIRLYTPMLLRTLLLYFRGDSAKTISMETALWCGAGISMMVALNAIIANYMLYSGFYIGMKIRVALCSLVYRKALRLNKIALAEMAPGKVVNLIANDVNRFDNIPLLSQYMWSGPFFSLIIMYILYLEVGYYCFIGMAIIFMIMQFQACTSKLMAKFRLKTVIRTDDRVWLMDEIISGMQVIKMYAWEKPFCAVIALARKLELQMTIRSAYIRSIYMTFHIFTARLALYGTLIPLLIFSQNLTADKVFIVMSYFNILSHSISSMLVRGIGELSECLVTLKRLQHFLMHEEYQSSNIIVCKQPSSEHMANDKIHTEFDKINEQDISSIDSDMQNREVLDDNDNQEKQKRNTSVAIIADSNGSVMKKEVTVVHNWAIKMTNVTIKWETSQSENILEDLNLEMEKGKLYTVIGIVGSGKSSLLNAILGEISLVNGETKVNGSVSYVSQKAWIFSSSIRQNILFGEEYDHRHYQRVIKACALLKDFQQFPQGDLTVIGERGSSLSGGQKARVNLARALYRQSDIYLLDDPLSAVDAHVSKHLFHNCIKRYLAGRTTILTTHQLQYIKEADGIILLEQGKIKYFSHYQDLLTYQSDFDVLLSEENEKSDELSVQKGTKERQFSSGSIRSNSLKMSEMEDDKENENAAKQEANIEKSSKVEGSLFVKYFQIGVNLYIASLVLFLFISTQFSIIFNDYFVSVLINAKERQYLANLESANQTNVSMNATSLDMDILPETTYIYIYTGIVLSVFVIAIIRSLLFYKVCLMCSQRLHDLMFNALIHTDLRFFDTNSSGSILNRFSKDMGAIDEYLPKAVFDASQLNFSIIGSLLLTCIIDPIFIVVIALMFMILYRLKNMYLSTSKSIKYLEGITCSPVFTHINVTLNGLSTIRAYHVQPILIEEFGKLQDLHTSSAYMHIVTITAFSFCLDVFCFILTCITNFTFLLRSDSYTGSEVGLVITQIAMICIYIEFGMRQNAETANQLMAVKRVIEYTQLLPEPNLRDRGVFLRKKGKQDLVLPANAPKNWPSEGNIKFKNVDMCYMDEIPILKELNIVIPAGKKIGIVGRTGAGKSSLISALLRLAKVEGIIEIDGVDTGSIALEDLRRKMSIIPQNPILFSGTIRHNLDPFNEFSDKYLWDALEEVELKDAITSTGNGLESRVVDRGNNYSVGQRQLVCLARAILRNNCILMLDEATANVDLHTDSLIQRTIRKKFTTCTMLTIAHRLNTIIDSDKVLVMDKGRMIEYDHPHILLQNSHSQFTSLAKKSNLYEQLVKVAKQSYIDKNGET
ncbi:multidrug resistance-associated protein 4-like isoform X2 [Harpegnathos saltator]|uniref:multidrug resistance-associated protein 4-like isoform X2 n=1 Tax=Harpegnathos saltator TaxID=610380 RepID=UPI0009489C66|nr:multidrug resistance-associated protein 4-like isoform X2 [Harpegnathos saltator]